MHIKWILVYSYNAIQCLHCFCVVANSDLSEQLEGLEHSLTCYLKQITDLCQLLLNQRSSGATGHSIADWLVQVQQLEREKAHLLE